VKTILDVKHIAVAMERKLKQISAEISHNNRRAVFSLLTVPRCYKKDKEDRLSHLSVETPTCQDMSMGAEELS
jgi:hypothetical protein